MASIPIQLFFWTIYHTVHVAGELNPNEFGALALIGGVYVILAFGLANRKKWAHRASVLILLLMALTSVIKLTKGLSHPSIGYLLFLITYVVSLILLWTSSVRKAFH